MAMTEFNKRVCEEYFRMKKPECGPAYLAAGGKGKEPVKLGSEILTKPECQAYLDELREERVKAVQIDAQWVLNQAVEVHKRCMQAEPVLDRDGEHVFVETAEGDMVPAYKFEHAGATKSLEIIGKHVGVQAFNEKTTVEVVDKSSILARARERAAKAKGE